jgi:site-specific DNA-methyltransferase (adenine-specific)
MIDPPYGDTSLEWDRVASEWIATVAAALAPSSALWLWGSMRYLLDVGPNVQAAGWTFSQDVVWEKHNGSGAAADRFRRVHEQALLFYRGPWGDLDITPQMSRDAQAKTVRKRQRPTHWGEIGEDVYYRTTDGGTRHMRSVMYERSAHGFAIHPTQKPEGVSRTLIQYVCPPGGLVLVPYAGSGTDLVAARAAGRRAIGVELDPDMAARAAARLAGQRRRPTVDEPDQLDLFATPVEGA